MKKVFRILREDIKKYRLPMLDTGLSKQRKLQEQEDISEKEFKDIHKGNRLAKEYTKVARRYKFGTVGGRWPGEEMDESRFVNGMLKKHYDNSYNGSFYGTQNEKGMDLVRNLDNALNHAATDRDMTVYTGLRTKPKTNAQGLAHMPGYVSSSLARNIAAHFTDLQENDEGHILQIHMPEGTRAASVNHVKSSMGPAEYNNEHEILIHRGHNIAIEPKPDKVLHGDKIYNIWKGRIVGHSPEEITKSFKGQYGPDETEYRKT